MNGVEPYRGIYSLGVMFRNFDCLGRRVFLRSDVNQPDLIVERALYNLVPIILKSRELDMGMNIEQFHTLRGKSALCSFTTKVFHSLCGFPTTPKISKILSEVWGRNGARNQASETAP